LFELVKVTRKDNVEYPRKYTDYNAEVKLSSVPAGVEIGFITGPYNEVCWNKIPSECDWFKVNA